MTTEAIYVWGTQKTLASSGASAASGTMTQATTASYAVVTDGNSFPDAEFVLRLQFATVTSIEGKVVTLYARQKNIDSTNHASVPTTTYLNTYIGNFVLSAAAANTDQYVPLEAFGVPKEADYYILNASGQTITAGWTLKVTPRSYKPA